MTDEVRLIDANSVCKKIVESIHCAEKWANEAKERQDTHGLRCAAEAITSLLAMLTRIHDEPTVEAEPDNDWISVKDLLPDDKERYLIYVKGGRKEIAYYQPVGDKFSNHEPFWQGSSCRFTSVTHWQPLPEPPKGE